MIAGDIYDKPVPSAEAVQLFDQFLTGLADCGKRCLQSVEIMIPRNVLHLVHSL